MKKIFNEFRPTLAELKSVFKPSTRALKLSYRPTDVLRLWISDFSYACISGRYLGFDLRIFIELPPTTTRIFGLSVCCAELLEWNAGHNCIVWAAAELGTLLSMMRNYITMIQTMNIFIPESEAGCIKKVFIQLFKYFIPKYFVFQTRKLAASRDIQCGVCDGQGGKNAKTCQVITKIKLSSIHALYLFYLLIGRNYIFRSTKMAKGVEN